MLPAAKWLEALNLPLRVMIGLALSSGLLLLLDWFGAVELSSLGAAVRPLITVVCVASTVFSVAGIGDLLLTPWREKQKHSPLSARRAVRQQEQEENRRRSEALALAHLDHLSKEEIHFVARCLREGTTSFYTRVYDPAVTTLRGKGLIWTPGGSHVLNHYHFVFHDFAWNELLRRRDEFIAKDEAHKRSTEAARKSNPGRINEEAE